jgi:predicted Fe-S protein YdhL (DUF1289 family)
LKIPDLSQTGGKVPSPCISLCTMDAVTGYCKGCYRTINEIATWGGAPEEWKLRVWRRIEQRELDDQATFR